MVNSQLSNYHEVIMKYIFLMLLLFSLAFSQTHYSLNFVSGESDYAYINSSTTWNFTTADVLIFLRVKLPAANTVIFSKYTSSSNLIYCGYTSATTTKYLYADWGTPEYHLVTTNGGSIASVWHSLIFYKDGQTTAQSKIYLDGIQLVLTDTTYKSNSWTNTADFRLFRHNTTYYSGQISKLAVWKFTGGGDTTLISAAASVLNNDGDDGLDFRINSGSYNFASSLVAYYEFNEGTGTTLTDLKGTENMTISGAAWSTNAPIFIRPSTGDSKTFNKYKKFKGFKKY